MIGIYKITSPKGKVYIGQSQNIDKRFEAYKRLSCKSQPKIYNSLKKYGVDNHDYDILIECEKEELTYYESSFINIYQSHLLGLNCKGGFNRLGVSQPHSEESKRLISQNKTGKPSKLKGRKYGKVKTPYNRTKIDTLILNTETGIYYDNIGSAAHAYSLKWTTLQTRLKRPSLRDKRHKNLVLA